jgi:hypothetical protein
MIITLINLKTIMFSYFTCAYEEENDIILINDLIDLTLSFLYECPKCKSRTVEEDCKEVYELEWTTEWSRQRKYGLKKCCRICYREWRIQYNNMRHREIRAQMLSLIINFRANIRSCIRRLIYHHHVIYI